MKKRFEDLSPMEMWEDCVKGKYYHCNGMSCLKGERCTKFVPSFDEVADRVTELNERIDQLKEELWLCRQAQITIKAAICPHSYVSNYQAEAKLTVYRCRFCGHEYEEADEEIEFLPVEPVTESIGF